MPETFCQLMTLPEDPEVFLKMSYPFISLTGRVLSIMYLLYTKNILQRALPIKSASLQPKHTITNLKEGLMLIKLFLSSRIFSTESSKVEDTHA